MPKARIPYIDIRWISWNSQVVLDVCKMTLFEVGDRKTALLWWIKVEEWLTEATYVIETRGNVEANNIM